MEAEKMDLQYVGSGSDGSEEVWKKNPMGSSEEKVTAVQEEMKRMNRLPPNSSYASHRLRVLNKILHLLSLQDHVTGSGAGVAICWTSNLNRLMNDIKDLQLLSSGILQDDAVLLHQLLHNDDFM